MTSNHELPILRIPVGSLQQEEGVSEMLDSPQMRIYIRLAEAVMQEKDTSPILEELSAIPLEGRYVWRVSCALKSALADVDDASAVADLNTLSDEDQKRVLELLNHRPIQFCVFMTGLFGADRMEQIMLRAIDIAKQVGQRR